MCYFFTYVNNHPFTHSFICSGLICPADDVSKLQVERIEGSVNDVYTVRSDLFLHGNVPIDEDSQ